MLLPKKRCDYICSKKEDSFDDYVTKEIRN